MKTVSDVKMIEAHMRDLRHLPRPALIAIRGICIDKRDETKSEKSKEVWTKALEEINQGLSRAA